MPPTDRSAMTTPRTPIGGQGPAVAIDPGLGPDVRPTRLLTLLAFVAVAVPAVALRLMYIASVGFNSDEAVYSGQGASMAGLPDYLPYFPVFRAHPLLFQSMVSLPYRLGMSPMTGRLLSALLGLGTVYLVYLTGRELYDRRVGWIAALVMALMPYHVVVSRQVLLDGPQTFFATATLLLIARYALTRSGPWLLAAGATLGLTFLTKETTVLLLGGVYAFFAIAPSVRTRLRHLIGATIVFVGVAAAYPVSLRLGGSGGTGGSFLAWQLFRRPNHSWTFYLSQVPPAIGVLVCLLALWTLLRLRPTRTWRETLLACWIVVPVVFFQVWPTKGFQYLLPIAPAVAILAAKAVVWLPEGLPQPMLRPLGDRVRVLRAGIVVLMVASLLVPSLTRVLPSTPGTTFLAGSGGVPGGREAGEWVGENLPLGATLLALGPSMANIIQFYGDRKTYGLSVSPNPLHRNPVYEPVINPDNLLRTNELQYLVWDSFSAGRSPFFSERLLRYARRYNGRIIHTQYVDSTSEDGEQVPQPVIVIYEVHPG